MPDLVSVESVDQRESTGNHFNCLEFNIGMKYNIYINDEAEDLSGRIKPLFESHSDDFKPAMEDRAKDIKTVVSNYTSGRKIVYATKGQRKDDIVGFLLINPLGFREPIKIYCPCHYVNLALVKEEYRNLGIGTSLLNESTNNFLRDGNQYLALRTRDDNTRMQSVVESIGFNFVGSQVDNGYERLYYVYRKKS